MLQEKVWTPETVDFGPAAFAGGIPHEMFAALRNEAPVFWYEPAGAGSPYWAITRSDDVRTASRDVALFSSWEGGVFIEDDELGPLEMAREFLIFMDPPKHSQHRRIVNRGFTPRAVAQLEGGVRRATNQLIDKVCEQGHCELVTEVAAQLPLQIMAELLGIPEADRPKVLEWIETVAEVGDPESRPSPEAGFEAASQMIGYAATLAGERLRCPAADLTTVLVQADVNGEKLTEIELGSFFTHLAAAGSETTRQAIALGTKALIEHPDERRKLEADPTLIDGAVEEILRWVTPIMYFRRTVTRDTELHGTTMRAGDRVVLWYASANFDERAYDEPYRFDVTRKMPDQSSFGGGGPHHCLGAPLARLELKVLFEELLRRMPEMEITGPVPPISSNWIRGAKQLPVSFRPTAQGDWQI